MAKRKAPAAVDVVTSGKEPRGHGAKASSFIEEASTSVRRRSTRNSNQNRQTSDQDTNYSNDGDDDNDDDDVNEEPKTKQAVKKRAPPSRVLSKKPPVQAKQEASKLSGKKDAESADESLARKSKATKTGKRSNITELGSDQEARPAKKKRKTKEEKAQEAMPVAARTKGLRHFIGAHVSIAKGVHNSVHNALHIGGNAFALFLKSQRKWDSPPLHEEHVKLFHGLCTDHDYSQKNHIVPHGSYLVNLASVTPEQREKSVTSFLDDMKRCERLGITLYNFHPGNTNGAPREEACARIAEAINQAHDHVPNVTPLLETMASNKAGSNVVGGTFEDLARVISAVKDKSRIGVCIDTCHIYAAGYDIASEDGFRKTMESFDKIIGRKYLRAWHLNDSKAPFGSGRDLHANIGTGFIGLKGFWNVMNMNTWGEGVGVCGVPMVLETPIDEASSTTSVDKKGKTVTKPVEDKGVWAREIKLLESLVGMDPMSAEFTKLEKELSERGREKREKMTAAVETKQAKEKLKQQRASTGKGRKKKQQVDEHLDEHSQDEEELGSELSEIEGKDGEGET